MRYFYCENLEADYVTLSDSEKKHLFSVLRAEKNSKIGLIDGKGGIAEGLIEDDKSISIQSLKQVKPPQVKVHLYVSPPRKQKMDLLLSQCTEAGVWKIHPIFTENTVALPKKETTIERWQLKLIEACKQSRNPFLPQIHPPITFEKALKQIKKLNLSAFFGSTTPGEDKKTLLTSEQSEVAWFVGPEGGFSQKEIASMVNAGFEGISLGKWIMRVETAAVVGTALLQH